RWMEAQRGTDCTKGRHGNAQLCNRADAVRPVVPRGRRGAHRSSDRRKGLESGHGGCLAAVTRYRPLFRVRTARITRPLLRRLLAARLASAAVLMVDD